MDQFAILAILRATPGRENDIHKQRFDQRHSSNFNSLTIGSRI